MSVAGEGLQVQERPPPTPSPLIWRSEYRISSNKRPSAHKVAAKRGGGAVKGAYWQEGALPSRRQLSQRTNRAEKSKQQVKYIREFYKRMKTEMSATEKKLGN